MIDTLEKFYNSVTPQQIKDREVYIPAWIRGGYSSKADAIDSVMKMMQKEDLRIAQLGLTGPIVKKSKHKRV